MGQVHAVGHLRDGTWADQCWQNHSPSREHGLGLHFAHLQTESRDRCLHELQVCKKLAGEAAEMSFSSILHLRAIGALKGADISSWTWLTWTRGWVRIFLSSSGHIIFSRPLKSCSGIFYPFHHLNMCRNR